jgi:hypothetical protein
LREQRLWLAVVLAGLAECVAPIGEHRSAFAALSSRARAWRAGRDFAVCCGWAGLDPNAARHMPPARAREALKALERGATHNEIFRLVS